MARSRLRSRAAAPASPLALPCLWPLGSFVVGVCASLRSTSCVGSLDTRARGERGGVTRTLEQKLRIEAAGKELSGKKSPVSDRDESLSCHFAIGQRQDEAPKLQTTSDN
ncbi:hypothetical protein GN958_ATG03447 [Phytophthora infestans]|uniref:Uncharacterized protein n=1 Tax=Phytophthora infestans TaxID=4787 RepID=A0A8S9V279_PHYIN|nr:hypothetical protein GN958_ATG03447 [Phytophthora infestans]